MRTNHLIVPATPLEMAELIKFCTQYTRWVLEQVEQRCGMRMPNMQISYDLKTGTAGQAFLQSHLIKYNPPLLRENPTDFCERTVWHEVMHHAAWHKYEERGHGETWKRMMRMFGKPDTRCHSYDVGTVPSRLGTRPNKNAAVVVRAPEGIVKRTGFGQVVHFSD